MFVLGVGIRVPALIFLVWGGAYVVRCANALSDPGVPVEYRYESEYGEMLVRADAYNFDLEKMEGFVQRVRVYGPSGREVASTTSVDFAMDGDVGIFRISDPVIRAQRQRDGTIDILKMLPITDEEEITGGAFRFYTERATIEYSDVAIEREPIRVFLEDVAVDGAGGTLMVRSGVDAGGARARAGGTYFENDGRLIADINFDRSDVKPLFDYLSPFLDEEALGEFADVKADELTMNGTLSIWSDADGVTVTGKGRIEGSGITTRETLRNATLVADVAADRDGLRVNAKASQRGITADYNGVFFVRDKLRAVGALSARAQNNAVLPPLIAQYVEPGVSFTGASFDGNVDTDGEKFLFIGNLTADSVTYEEETTTDVAGSLRLNEKMLIARIDHGVWAGLEYTGAVGIDFETGKLSGGVQTPRSRLETVSQRFGTDRLAGLVSIVAILGGTMDAPETELYARGSGGLRIDEGPLLDLGVFEARGHTGPDGLAIQRLTANGPNGVIAASGSMAWGGEIDFTVSGGGIDASALSEDLRGIGFLNAKVGGTTGDPRAMGRLEVYGFEALERKVPQLVVDWSSDETLLTLDRIAGRAGTGQIGGRLTMRWDDHRLAGEFSGTDIRTEEWIARETIGSVAVENGRVTGTLEDPLVTADLLAGTVYIGAVEVQSATAELRIDKEGATSNAFVVSSNGGQLDGSARFDFSSKTGSLAATAKQVPLSMIPLADYALALDGLAGGDVSATFDLTGILTADTTLRVEQVNINGTAFGRGDLEARLENREVTGNLLIGSSERYLDLESFRYGLDTKKVTGTAYVYNMLVEDLVEAAGETIAAWPTDLLDLLRNTKGHLNAGVTVTGDPGNPDVNVESLVLTELTVRGRDAGVFRATGQRQNGVWTVQPQEGQPVWLQGDTNFTVRGTVTETGAMDVVGDLYNFQAEWAHTLFPNVPLFTGQAEQFSFDLEGPWDDPVGRATLITNKLGYFRDERAVNLPLEVRLDVIEVGGGVANIEGGSVTYQGVTASITKGVVPFSAFYEDPDGRQPLDIELTFEQSFESAARFIPVIDAETSVGDITGRATITGLLETIAVSADIRAIGESLGLTMGSRYRDVNAVAKWEGTTASIDATFAGESGGTGAIDFTATFPDVFTGELDIDTVKRQTRLNGTVDLEALRLQFLLPDAERVSGATFTTQDLKIAGTIAAPSVSGNVDASDVYVRLPDEFAGSGAAIVYPVDPVFSNVTLTVAPGARIVTDSAQVVFFGSGRIEGSLQNPDLSIPLTVTGGRYDMPTARITIEEGGTITLGYRSALGSAPTARVDLNLEGHTTLSARRATNEYEAYDVQLLIRGNLLEENGLTISASSDPPDLSSEQIMAILGQKELIEGLAHGGSDTDLRGTLYTFGLPAASSVLTSGLARDLGLDYISLDYNPFDQTVVSIGKSIGKGLMLQASRQLAPNPGERLKYEVQLTYRLPLDDPFFSRVRLGFGFNQDVPWQLKLNWARRF
jgi:hypothetical protein